MQNSTSPVDSRLWAYLKFKNFAKATKFEKKYPFFKKLPKRMSKQSGRFKKKIQPSQNI